MADPNALAHVLDKLVCNAQRYSSAGGSVALVVGDGAADRARIAMLDSGAGRSAGQRRQLFQRCMRLDAGAVESRDASGGLGLALAKQGVGQMQVELWYELPMATPAEAIAGDTPMPPSNQPMA